LSFHLSGLCSSLSHLEVVLVTSLDCSSDWRHFCLCLCTTVKVWGDENEEVDRCAGEILAKWVNYAEKKGTTGSEGGKKGLEFIFCSEKEGTTGNEGVE
jgi:hypothetical protein